MMDIIYNVSTRKSRVLKVNNRVVRATELSKRKLQVLSAIVESYIKTGEPIGSKNLMTLIENSPSSATLRNEMNALCSLGLLSQPHTSAGRAPTSDAYRLYVTKLMKPQTVAEQTKDYIVSQILSSGFDTENIPKAAANALTSLTDFPSVFCSFVDDNVTLKQIKLLPISRKTAVLLVVFSDGRTKNTVCQIPSGFTADITTEFTKIVTADIKGKPLNLLTRAYLQSIIAKAGLSALNTTPLLTSLFALADTAANSNIELVGESNLYNFCDDNDARKIISLVNPDTPFDELLKSERDDNDIIFGSDTDISSLDGKVIITSKYYCKTRPCGKIGIIAPNRVEYQKIVPSVQYIAQKLTDVITDTVNDMED